MHSINKERLSGGAHAAKETPNPAAAYLLWFFAGMIGAHRFYLGRRRTALIQFLNISTAPLLFLAAVPAQHLLGNSAIGFALIIWLVVFVAILLWTMIDLLFISSMIRNREVEISY